jgi:tripartite-type tricarboxylate transporter receptor subunit TctC
MNRLNAMKLIAFALTGLAFSSAPSGAAEAYPGKPIELIVPYAPGGASDVIVRALVPHLQKQLGGATVVVTNRAGANTAIAATQLARALPDGHTLMLADAALVLNAAVRASSPGYDLDRDFSMVTQIGAAPLVLFVPESGARDLPKFLDQARTRGANVANAGSGSLGHLAAELLQLRTKTSIVSVPYRGSALALNETIAGQVDATFTSTASGMPLVKTGRLRALAVAATEPIAAYPDIPTFEQLGVAGVAAVNWWGVIGPAGLPPGIVARLSQAIRAAMREPALAERFEALGIVPTLRDAKGFSELMHGDLAHWRSVVQRAQIKVD